MNYLDFEKLLISKQDLKYKEFTTPISNCDYEIIGIRLPILKEMIKNHYQDNDLLLEDFKLGVYQEVDVSYFCIGLLRCKNSKEQLQFLKENIHFAQSWTVTDTLNHYIKKVSFHDYSSLFKTLHKKKHIYSRRFAYVFGLKFYKDEQILKVLPLMTHQEDYMVMMGQAWLLATIAIVYPDQVYEFLRDLDDKALVRKTISKMCDSYRIEDKTKEKFKELRNKF